MGLIGRIKNWFTMPLTPNADIVNLTLYVGLLFILVWLWGSVIGTIRRME